jgi:PPP family 3-phenylpropionic acid transporter
MRLIPVYITFFLIYGVILPYLPILVRNLGYRAAVVGILLAVSEGAGILGPFVFGHFADKRGKYKGCLILAYILILAFALPLARFVHPAASVICIAMLAVGYRSALPLLEAVATINLGKDGNYGRIRVTGSISFVCFVLFLQWVPILRPNTPLNIALWIGMTSALAVLVIILIPLRYTSHKSTQDTSTAGCKARRKIWTPVFILGLLCIALSRLAMTPINSFLSLFMVEYMHWDAVGFMWALASAAEIPFLYLSHRLIRRFGALPILAFTSAMVGLRLSLYAAFPFKAGVIIAQLLHSFCYGLFHPAAVAFIAECVPPEHRAFGMTLYFSVGLGIPTFIGNFAGGFIVDHAGYRSLFGYFTIFAFLGTALYVICQGFIRKGRKGQSGNGAHISN